MSKFTLVLLSSTLAAGVAAAQPAGPAEQPGSGAPAPPTPDTSEQTARLEQRVKALEEQLAKQAAALQAQVDNANADAERKKKEAEDRKAEEKKSEEKKKKSGFSVPEWVTRFEDKSDLRLRFDEAKSPAAGFVTRKRWRPRLRLGGLATLNNDWEIGFRVTSTPTVGRDTGGDPLSTNQTFEDNASRKPLGVDWAFARWTPLHVHDVTGSITLGKMENPPNFTEDVFDVDYTPEGAAETVGWKKGDHAASVYLGQFVLDELQFSKKDPFLLVEQLHEESSWNKRVSTAVNVSGVRIGHASQLTTASVPDSNHGNSRNITGALKNNYNLFVADAGVTFKVDKVPGYKKPFPILLFGEFIHNYGVSKDNTGYSIGATLGSVNPRKIGKEQRGNWELSYRYQHLEGDYNYEELTASDNGAFYKSPPPNEPAPTSYKPTFLNGTNLRGSAYRAAYAPLDSLMVDLRVWRNEAINVASAAERVTGTRVLFDLVWKF